MPPDYRHGGIKKIFLDLDSLSNCKTITNTESCWQIIQSEKNGQGGEVCVVWVSGAGRGGVVVSEFF